MRNHQVALLLAGVAMPFAPQCSVAAEDVSRPANIVVILADDLGYADISVQGSRDVHTPNIDEIAKNGVRCTSGYVSCPYCSPTRAALLTGRYQQRFGHEFNPPTLKEGGSGQGLNLNETTIAQRLKNAGYATGLVGKWHLGEDERFHPLNRGFQEFFGFLPGAHDYLKKDDRAYGPIYRGRQPVDLDGYLTDVLAREAIAFIDRHREKPFFLYLAFNAVHTPLQAPEPALQKFAAIGDRTRRTYAAMTAKLDEAVGNVLGKLHSVALEERTLVFFLSDNGGPIGKFASNGSRNTPLRGSKGDTWEGGIRVPFLVQWKGKLPSGKIYNPPVIQLDIHATALAAAGIQVKPSWKLDGVNLLPFLEGKDPNQPHAALYWRFGEQMAIRMADWKLVRPDMASDKPFGDIAKKPMLFNLREDIGESKDLADARPEKVQELYATWQKWNQGLTPPAWQHHSLQRPPRTDIPAAGRPNIVLILADDLGAKDLGCYGSTYHRTPHLDRLAAAGMKFTDAYAACPVCSPTRASILTGKYPPRYNVTTFLSGRPDRPDQKLLQPVVTQHLGLEEVTLATVLNRAGYATGHIGKWHLGGEGFGPLRHGFGSNVAGDAAGAPRRYFAPFVDGRGNFMPGLEQAPQGEYLTDRLGVEAEKFIEKNRDRPFFLYLAHYAPHIPLRAKPELVAKYPKDLPPGQQNNPIYAAMLESLDDSVGRVVATLDRLKLSEKTIVLFTSDNGGLSVIEGPNTPATINAPFRDGKGYVYEGGIREPLLWKWPGHIRPGSVSDMPVCSIDFFPTLLDLGGLKNEVKVDGISVKAVLQGGPSPHRDALYWHFPHYTNQGGKPGGAIRAGNYKLIEWYEDGRRELYDVRHDPGEIRNLVAEKPELVAALAGKLISWRQSVGARMPRPNPDFVPNRQAANGTITLPARTADVHGIQLRYETLPHKSTLGFWTRLEDWTSWDFTLAKPGAFTVEILQGCGKGQGGSEVEFAIGTQTLRTKIEDTGSFQNFKSRALGTVQLDKPGRYTLTVRPKTKPGIAVMDLRAVTLKPLAQ